MKTKIIAEAGLNHNGSIRNAKKLIDIAFNSKAQYVKFQLYKTEELYNSKINKNFKDIAKRFNKREFSLKQWRHLINYSKLKKVKLFFSIFETKSLEIVKKLKIRLLKIPSGEITNYQLLKDINKNKFKVILSTGMSDLKEIKKALSLLKNCEVIILYCVSEYPAKNIELNYINFLKKTFPKNKIGFSDHTTEIYTPALAIYHGAEFIEKHFTFNKNFPLGDHKMSLDGDELKKMVELIKAVEKFQKKIKSRSISHVEKKLKFHARKGIYFFKNKKKGEKIYYDDLKFLRPQKGIKSEDYKKIIGKSLIKNVNAFEPLSLKMFK